MPRVMPPTDRQNDPSLSSSQLARCVADLADRLQAGDLVDLRELCVDCPEHLEQLEMLLPTLQAVALLDHSVADQANDRGAGAAKSPTHESTPDELRGVLGDFRLIREIGRGGMGVVYEAEQLSLGRRVALKVLPFAAMLDKQQLARFKNEARAAATLDHPNIVPVHFVGCDRGVHYYAMHLVEGESLAQVIARLRKERVGSGQSAVGSEASSLAQTARFSTASDLPAPSPRAGGLGRGDEAGPRDQLAQTAAFRATDHGPPTTDTVPVAALSTLHAPHSSLLTPHSREYFRTVARLGIQAAEALDHAHQSGILHRDVKPANLLVECSHLAPRDELSSAAKRSPNLHHAERDDDTPKLWVTDFGLARFEADAGMTMTGDLLGTLRYMSPEQVLGKRGVVDQRSDIYSLGVTLYELLTLRPVYAGHERQEIQSQIALEDPQRPRILNDSIPLDLETIILKAIRKDAASRYATALDLAGDLRRFVEHRPILARPVGCLEIAKKWLLRHKYVLWSLGATLLMTTIGSAASAILISRERQVAVAQLVETMRNRERADKNFRSALHVLESLTERENAPSLGNGPAVQSMRSVTGARVEGFLKEFLRDDSSDPAIRLHTGIAYVHLGRLYTVTKKPAMARDCYQRACNVFRALVRDIPPNLVAMRELAICEFILGRHLNVYGQVASAVFHLDRSEAVWRQCLELAPNDLRALEGLVQLQVSRSDADPEVLARTKAALQSQGAATMRWARRRLPALIEFASGNWQIAVDILNTEFAQKMTPPWILDNPFDHYILSMAYSRLGKLPEARAHYDIAIEDDREFQEDFEDDSLIRAQATELIEAVEWTTIANSKPSGE